MKLDLKKLKLRKINETLQSIDPKKNNKIKNTRKLNNVR